jgi:microcystin-dependent protein
MAVRTVTEVVKKPDGSAWVGAEVRFEVLEGAYRLSPGETYPVTAVIEITDTTGAFSVDLVSGPAIRYRVTLPDGEQFPMDVPDGSTTTVEALRAATEGAPSDQSLESTVLAIVNAEGFNTNVVKQAGATVVAAAAALDFGDGFTVTESPAGEANVTYAGVPAGVMAPYAGLSVPSGWLLCDGSSVSRATYAALFAALTRAVGTVTVTIAAPGVFTRSAHGLAVGSAIYLTTTGALPTGLAANTTYYVVSVPTADTFTVSATRGGAAITTSGSQSGTHSLVEAPYGVGGSTVFNLPDLRGRTVVGRSSVDTEFDAIGETGGAKTHLLTAAESGVPAHTHPEVTAANTGLTAQSGATYNLPQAGQAATTGANTAASAAQAHNNLPPYLAALTIIKT